MTSSRTALPVLCRRELGRRFGFVLTGSLLLGAGAALAHAHVTSAMRSASRLLTRPLAEFDATLATALAVIGAFRIIARTLEDRVAGGPAAWCVNGRRCGGYTVALYLASVAALAAVLVAGVSGHALMQALTVGGVDLSRSLARLALGSLLIGGMCAYGLVLGVLTRSVVAAVILGMSLFLAPFVVGAVVVVSGDLDRVPDWMWWTMLHLPAPVMVETPAGLRRQVAYIIGAVALSAALAWRRAGLERASLEENPEGSEVTE